MDYIKPFKYILEIARCQSITEAAENLNVRQPALSKYLKKVENELGVELFDRSVSPIAITDAGKCYLSTAQRIIDSDNQLLKQINEIKNGEPHIRIGISPSRAPYLLPNIFNKFLITHKNVKLSVFEGTTGELNSKLMHGDLDLIISIENEDTKDFTKVELFVETVILAVPENSGFNSFEEVFRSKNIISSGKGQLLTELLKTFPDHESRIDCQNLITAIELVRLNLGAALVPSYLAKYGNVDDLSFIDIPDEFSICRNVCAFYRKEQYLSDAECGFIQSAVEVTKT